MPDFSSALSTQIFVLLQSLDSTNVDDVLHQLRQFVEVGTEESILVLQNCLEYQYLQTTISKDLKSSLLNSVFSTIFKYILDKPNFSTVFSQSLRNTAINHGFLDSFCNTLNLSSSEKMGAGLALADSDDLDVRLCGKNFCISQIEELCGSPVRSTEHIQNMIIFLHQSGGLSKHLDSFMQMLSLVPLKDSNTFVLAPLLPDALRDTSFMSCRNMDSFYDSDEDDLNTILEEMDRERSMNDVFMELGYVCTVNVSQCKEILSLFLPLTEVTLARLITTIARTYGGLDDHQGLFSALRLTLGGNALLDLPSPSSWNVDVLIDSIGQLAPGIKWIDVIENLDHEGFYLPNMEAFSFLMSVYRCACQDLFPLHAVCGSVWKNTEGQLSFLRHAVLASPEVFSFAHSTRRIENVDGMHNHMLQLGTSNYAWLSLDLLDVLCQIAELGHAHSVRSVLEFPLKYCPEVLLLGLAHINTTYSLIQYEVLYAVFPTLIKNSSGSSTIIRLWNTNPNLVIRGFGGGDKVDLANMSRILDVCKELKNLSFVLEMLPSSFAIRLAALASQKDLIDLDKWLTDNIITYKDTFAEECLKFLKEVHFGEAPQDMSSNSLNDSDGLVNLNADSTSAFLKVLQANTSCISSSHLSEEISRLQGAVIQTNVKLKGEGVADSSASGAYAIDIETESNSYFHKLFCGQLTVDAIVESLGRFKESADPREVSIFNCMISNLFEEYKFFPKYPEAQLKIAAVLFGCVIKHQLVTHLTLGIALRGVLDALRKPADSKMFVFGTMALDQFSNRLVEWPQYCNHILQISHLRSSHPDLVSFVEGALAKISHSNSESHGANIGADQNYGSTQLPGSLLQSIGSSFMQNGPPHQSSPLQLQQKHQSLVEERHKVSATLSNPLRTFSSPAGQSSISAVDTSNAQKIAVSASGMLASSPSYIRPSRAISSSLLRPHSASTGFGSALNIETLVAAAEKKGTPIEAPASEVQDKISFIINNISAANVESKAKEFSDVLREQYYPWFAQYMVMKRASIEPNFHELYLKFLDKVNSKPLNKEIVETTYENCKVLLGSELIKSSSEERSLLKNLGSWLGKFTIGRNQVLRAREIDFKPLIIEAYEKGLMIAVIPFTSKVLEACQSSIAYQPPNPWTMGILGLLSEIYAMPNLKMNLKFDIEVLFKNLGVDMKDVTPSSLLKDRVRAIEGNPDFSNKDVGVSQPQITADSKPAIVSALNQIELPLEVSSPSLPGSHAHMLSQYDASRHISSTTMIEDEKLAALGLPDQISSAQALLQAASQTPFTASQPISTIGTHVVINPKLNAGLHLHFQRVVPVAMDRAIKEIVNGIVQRSVSIATQTTKELVLKDYAMETDETRILNAAHLMVASLAGSLAHVTCKEPLRVSISTQLRNSLQSLNMSNELDQAVLLVTNDNLDLGCAVIEQAATDKAIQTIDGEITQQLSLRRKHRDGIASTFYDPNIYSQGAMGAVPDALRPKPGSLSQSQQRVYEDFVRLPWQNQSGQSSDPNTADPSASSGGGLSHSYGAGLVTLPGTFIGLEHPRPQPLDVHEEMDSSSFQLLNASSSHIVGTHGITQQVNENDPMVTSYASSTPSVSELSSLEPSIAVKDSVASSLPLPPSVPATSATQRLGNNVSEPLLSTGDALEKYQIVSQKLESLAMNNITEADIQGIIAEVPEILLRCVSRDQAALAVVQRVFAGFHDFASSSLCVAAHLAMLTAIREVCRPLVKEVTSWVISSPEDRKVPKDIVVALIVRELLNLGEYDLHLAKLIDNGRNKAATEFVISLLQSLVVEEPGVISELHNLVDALAKIASRPGCPESLQQLLEVIRNPSGSVTEESKIQQSKDRKTTGNLLVTKDDYSVESVEPDPAGFQEQVSALFAEWYQICELPGANDAACTRYVLKLQQNGFLKGDDMSDRFFRRLTELSVSHCLSSEVIISGTIQTPQQVQPLSFLAIDIYSKLVSSILRYCPGEQGSSKLFLLSKVFAVTVRIIHKDTEEKKALFNPRPYFRLFFNWLLDLCTSDLAFDANFQVLTSFANAFHALQPLKIPAFSFVWLELVSHRSFMPKLLTGNQKGWPLMQRLLVDLFQFLEPFLRNAELGEPVQFLYKGTIRVLLVLLHDFPEFLCEYHFTFCDVIPPSCIQMRNIILSAFPRNMRLPDPSTPNLKIDLLGEINLAPRILSEVDAALKSKQMKSEIDEYLTTRPQGTPFLAELKKRLLLQASEAAQAGTRYNVPLINSLVLYVGMQAIQQLQARSPPHSQPSNPWVFLVGAALDIYQALIADLDTEGRYLFLNAIANQLRYPNNHTHYFSFILLFLFADSDQEIIQEQITRVLLERLIANRPHPWGLLITFLELIKNPRYNFWSRSFIRCAPDIEKLFGSVSKSIGGPKPVNDESFVSG